MKKYSIIVTINVKAKDENDAEEIARFIIRNDRRAVIEEIEEDDEE